MEVKVGKVGTKVANWLQVADWVQVFEPQGPLANDCQ